MPFDQFSDSVCYYRAVTSKRTYSPMYVNGILRNWKARGVLTVADPSKEEHSKMPAKANVISLKTNTIFEEWRKTL